MPFIPRGGEGSGKCASSEFPPLTINVYDDEVFLSTTNIEFFLLPFVNPSLMRAKKLRIFSAVISFL
jgi:hypothetical protein